MGHCLVTDFVHHFLLKHWLKWLSSLAILMQDSFWWWQRSDWCIISLSSSHASFPPISPSLISLMVSVDVKHHVYLLTIPPPPYPPSPPPPPPIHTPFHSFSPSLISLMVSVDVKHHVYLLTAGWPFSGPPLGSCDRQTVCGKIVSEHGA